MASYQPFLIALTLVLSLGLALPLSPSNALLPRDKTHPTWGCSFPGNSDLYGLGIRVGVYLQLLSTLLANAFLTPANRHEAHNTNSIIMIALFAALATSTFRSQMNSVEIFVMSTLLTAFLWSDFTPAHISAIVLFEDGAEGTVVKNRWIYRYFAKNELQEEETKDGKKRYFAAISRSIFGTANALFNCWYWLWGRHLYIKNGITGQEKCQPTIFLHTQILLNGYQPMFYLVLSVIYAVYEVLFMLWWVAILAPGTIRLCYDIVFISLLGILTWRIDRFGEIRVKTVRWYLGFARLDPRTLRIFDRVRMSRKTQERLKSGKYFVTWFGAPAGYSVIIWSALAIEMTMAWNVVSGVYTLSSTGQLIPFVVGVLGLLRSFHLITVRMSEKAGRKGEREIRVALGEGKFVYNVGSERELILDASRPERRRSIDAGSFMYQMQ